MNEPAVQQESNIGDAIRMLGDLLGETIVGQSGQKVFDLEEEIRALSKSWRAGNETANEKLGEKMVQLAKDLSLSADIVKAFSTYFQLVNLAEEHQRVSILRNRANNSYLSGVPMDESILNSVATLQREGIDANRMQEILARLLIVPVFTAHPTESRRRTTRQILKKVSATIQRLQSTATLDFERPTLIQELKTNIVLLWQSDQTRPHRPTVMDEVRNTGLYFFEETLFDVVPQIYEELEWALKHCFPDSSFNIPTLLKYGSWIGGDRDGNPLVTNEVTEAALRAHKELALERYAADIFNLYELLSVSRNRSEFSAEFLDGLRKDLDDLAQDTNDVVNRFELEPYRQKLILMYRKLKATTDANKSPWGNPANTAGYGSAAELLQDLNSIRSSLNENNCQDLTRGPLSSLIRRVQVFGFHLATIDVRQHADRHRTATAEIFESQGIKKAYAELPETEKIAILSHELDSGRPFTAQLNFSDLTNETVSVFRLIAQAQKNIGTESMQTYIISMTENVSNMLEVLLFMQDAGLFGKLDLVPLFETVDDLNQAPQTMAALFENPHYRRHLEMRGNSQQIMIGYSDSNKDGGYLRANWMLFTAQRKLADTCKKLGVELTLFHGRGGSLGRGGGPANRAILAQPPESVNGRIRVTEQGEVVSSRYSNRSIAKRHLQQLLHAVLCSTGKRPEFPKLARWSEIMDEISEIAFRKYRSLVDHPLFIEYFQTATPIELVENLNIGSRPSRRKSSKSIDDLRAIPWVFSWTQSRVNISSWYGIGSALHSWTDNNPDRNTELQEMFLGWPYFNTLFKNVHLGLGRADMDIAGLYAQLATDNSRKLYDDINTEFELTCESVLRVTGDDQILDTESWLQHSIRMRNPYVDPLNYIQVALLERLRGNPDMDESTKDELVAVLANSVNGIAAGLQNVG